VEKGGIYRLVPSTVYILWVLKPDITCSGILNYTEIPSDFVFYDF
jgi:hypothetical protein